MIDEVRSGPLVSVVIPTRNRADLACRAVRSVSAQTYTNIEIIVVVDGPDPASVEALTALGIDRLHIVALEQNVGGSEARNVGVRNAGGDWIAFLDDDDEWFVSKLEKQLETALAMSSRLVFVGSQFIQRDNYGDRILPVFAPIASEAFSEYLLGRTRNLGAGGYVQTSTWLVSGELARSVEFARNLKRNQDIDWMLHAVEGKKAAFQVVMEPLAIFHSEQQEGRISKKPDWRFHYEWALLNRKYMTPRALAYFLSTVCAVDAAKQGESISAFSKILSTIVRANALSPRCLVCLLYYITVPERARTKVRLAVSNGRRRPVGRGAL